MRIFNSSVEMLEETYRELWKRGQTVFDKTVQGRVVAETEFEQKELVFYSFRVDDFSDMDLMIQKAKELFKKEHHTMKVAEQWLWDILNNNSLKETWWDMTEYTKKYFKDFCDEGSGNASYSYGERVIPQLDSLFKRLRNNKYARGAVIILPIPDDINRIGRRVPCSTSWHFLCRPTLSGDKLNLIVNQRSCDAINFFPLDFIKAVLLLKHVAKELNLDYGYIIMSIDSLHVYKRDIPAGFQW